MLRARLYLHRPFGRCFFVWANMIKDAGKKVFLILDNLRVYHSKPVKAWVAERQDKIELFYLPSYSPELNPEERLNADLKHAIGTQVPARTKAKLKAVATQHMMLTPFRGHLNLMAQGVHHAKITPPLPGGIPPTDH